MTALTDHTAMIETPARSASTGGPGRAALGNRPEALRSGPPDATSVHSPYLTLLILSLASHGLLLLNDGVYWDDWLVYTHLLEGDWTYIYSSFRDAGLPQLAYFHWAVGNMPAFVFTYKLVAFLSITGSALLVFRICSRHLPISRLESLVVSAVFLTYPAVQVFTAAIVAPYAVGLFCFYLASCLSLDHASKIHGRRPPLRILSLMLFAFSFTIGSLIVFYLGFLGLLLAVCYRRDAARFSTLIRRWPLHHLDYLLLPFVYWVATRYFFAPRGQYDGYNEVAFSLYRLLKVGSEFVASAILGQTAQVVSLVFSNWSLLALCMAAALLVGLRLRRWNLKRAVTEQGWKLLLAGGIILLGLAILPYAAVGKAPDVHGWKTRHALLIGLPVGLLTMAAIKYLVARFDEVGGRIGIVVVTAAIVAFCAANASSYLSWQARWAKDRSVMTNLSDMPGAGSYSVYLVDDRFPSRAEPTYRYYEWASLFKTVWGDESRIGIALGTDSERFLVGGDGGFRRHWNLADLDIGGPQAALTIRKGRPDLTDHGTALVYLWYRYARPGQLETFLSSLTRVDVRPVAPNRQSDENL